MRGWMAFGVLLSACGLGQHDPAQYQQKLDALEATVQAHQSAGTVEAMTACTGEHTGYDAQARAQLGELEGMAPGMDGEMGHMGAPAGTGFGGMCRSMGAELDLHASQACGADLDANHREATRHCTAMLDWVAQQRQRIATSSHCGR